MQNNKMQRIVLLLEFHRISINVNKYRDSKIEVTNGKNGKPIFIQSLKIMSPGCFIKYFFEENQQHINN